MSIINNVVWDIDAKDFDENSQFSALMLSLTNDSFSDLIACEAKEVELFLAEWQAQLLEFQSERSKEQSLCLKDLFLKTPSLSGVLYLSNNRVISEAFFDGARESIDHLTDRKVAPAIQQALPWTKELSFSFPRKYLFYGYYNSWGFIRFPRKDDQGNDAGVLISCTTLDPYIMSLLDGAGFSHIGSLYNRVWDGAIHDYIHHLGLYTNPSFGIGAHSPMSIANVHEEIDAWGQSMMSTFNYEYWAHRTHRLITSVTLTGEEQRKIVDKACEYVREVYAFYGHLILMEQSSDKIEGIIGYLLAIYLWPLSIQIDPSSDVMKNICFQVNEGPYKNRTIPAISVSDLLAEYGQLTDHSLKELLLSNSSHDKLKGIRQFVSCATSGIDRGIASMLLALGLEEWTTLSTLSWYEWLRAYTDIIGRRGLYEGWSHNIPIYFEGEEIHPHEASLRILDHVSNAYSRFEDLNIANYQLSRIVKKWNG